MSLQIYSRLSVLRALGLFLCLASPLLGESNKPVTFATFSFDDDTLKAQERGQNTDGCLEKLVVADLNQQFMQRPLLKYWNFQVRESSQYPYLWFAIHWLQGWSLRLRVVDPRKGESPPPLEESLSGLGGTSTPSGCHGWAPVVLNGVHRLIEQQESDLQKTLRYVPVTGIIKPLSREWATVQLSADSDRDMFQRRFLVELIGPQQRPGIMYPCGTGKPMKLSAEVRLSPLSSTPPDAVPGFVAKRYAPVAVYLGNSCEQAGISVVK